MSFRDWNGSQEDAGACCSAKIARKAGRWQAKRKLAVVLAQISALEEQLDLSRELEAAIAEDLNAASTKLEQEHQQLQVSNSLQRSLLHEGPDESREEEVYWAYSSGQKRLT